MLRQDDIARINALLADANCAQDENSLRIRDGILWLRIRGNFETGQTALKALLDGGINQVIDNDLTTRENRVIYKAGADYSIVWIDFVDHAPLFRGV